jgi:putative DNA primase/helicase
MLHDYHRAAPIETFTVSQSDRHPTDLAGLLSARLVTATETEDGRRWSEARIKQLTGGDKISARFMRQDFFDFIPQFKLLFSGNHMPTLRTVNKAITRRFNRIPFAVTIANVNKNLGEELKVEWPGILAWAIEGCMQWQQLSLCPPASVTNATESYLESQDIVGEWLNECFVRDANAWTSSTVLFDSWKIWATERDEWVGSVNTLSAKLEDRGEFARRTNPEKTKRGFAGLRLKEVEANTKADAFAAVGDARKGRGVRF